VNTKKISKLTSPGPVAGTRLIVPVVLVFITPVILVCIRQRGTRLSMASSKSIDALTTQQEVSVFPALPAVTYGE